MVRVGLVAAAAWAVAGAGVAAAETDGEPELEAAAAVGAGARCGQPLQAIDLAADLRHGALALGLGVRLRLIGDRFAVEDWDEVGDGLAVIRYLEWSHGDAERGFGIAAGTLAPLELGTVADGYTAAIDADRLHAGVRARAAIDGWSGQVALDDAAGPAVIAARADRRVDAFTFGVQGGVDPGAPAAMGTAALGMFAIDGGARTETAAGAARVASALDGGLAASLAGVGAWLGAGTETRWAGATVAVRVDGTVGSGGFVPAPFGPLYRVTRAAAGRGMDAPTLVERVRAGDLGGVGGGAALRVELLDLARVEAAMRFRPGLGGEARAGVALPQFRVVQAAAWVAAAPRLGQWAAAAELRAPIARRLQTGLEAARLYGTEGLDAPRPVWQVTAWFGVRAGP